MLSNSQFLANVINYVDDTNTCACVSVSVYVSCNRWTKIRIYFRQQKDSNASVSERYYCINISIFLLHIFRCRSVIFWYLMIPNDNHFDGIMFN